MKIKMNSDVKKMEFFYVNPMVAPIKALQPNTIYDLPDEFANDLIKRGVAKQYNIKYKKKMIMADKNK